MLAERAQARAQRLTDFVEALVHILETFRCDSFHAHQRALDVGAPHGIEERRVLGRVLGRLHVICVKNTMSDGNCARRSVNSNRSARSARSLDFWRMVLLPRGECSC
jgi:hypothetical protein